MRYDAENLSGRYDHLNCLFFEKKKKSFKINLDLKDQPSLFLCKGCKHQKIALIKQERNLNFTIVK